MERPRDPGLAARLFGGSPEHTLALLRALWPGAVGEELARRTELVGLERGVLRVKVPDLRWQRTLLRMRGEILGRLRRVAGQAAPGGLAFATGDVAGAGVPMRAAPPGTLPSPASPPAPPAPPSVARAATAIADPEIRERFLAAAGCYLSRFREGQAVPGGGSSRD